MDLGVVAPDVLHTVVDLLVLVAQARQLPVAPEAVREDHGLNLDEGLNDWPEGRLGSLAPALLVTRTDPQHTLATLSADHTKDPGSPPFARISSSKFYLPKHRFINLHNMVFTTKFHLIYQPVIDTEFLDIVEPTYYSVRG